MAFDALMELEENADLAEHLKVKLAEHLKVRLVEYLLVQ